MARSQGLAPQKRREFLGLLRGGATRSAAARIVGCSLKTIMAAARRDPTLADEMVRSEEVAEWNMMQNIRNASAKAQYWRAAAWALERSRPDRYAARSAGAVQKEQLVQLLTHVVDIITEEVPVAKLRSKVLRRLDKWVAQLETDGQGEKSVSTHFAPQDNEPAGDASS